MIGNDKTFKVKDKNNKLGSFHINDAKVLKTYKATWAKTEDLEILD